MASPAIAVPAQVNGGSTTTPVPLSRSQSPMTMSSSTKRKRDDGDDGSPEAGTDLTSPRADVKPTATVNGTMQKPRDQRLLVREYFDILRRCVLCVSLLSVDAPHYITSVARPTDDGMSCPFIECHDGFAHNLLYRYDSEAGILKQPLPDGSQTDAESEAKRRKSEDEIVSTPALSVEEKVQKDGYANLEDILADVTRAAKTRVATLGPSARELNGSKKADDLVTKIAKLKEKAHDLYRRELAYPSTERLQSAVPERENAAAQGFSERALLMTYAAVNNGKKPLLTSLQKPVGAIETGDKTMEAAGASLPAGITLAHAANENLALQEPGPSRTLGELFPPPRNLPPLQPPKPNKGTTRSNVLSFYHPVLTNQSSHRTGTYFSQVVSTGQWLDYSNATPATHKKTKQRERAQSLAGVKPSSTELEMSEMEALFRGAFSSFAPCKDDTGAVVSSGQVSCMYWQRYGRRSLQRMIDSEVQVDDAAPSETPTTDETLTNNLPDVDEDVIKEVLDSWDDAVIDPSLADVMGQKSDEDKEVEDVLQEVSDLIETLASYQRNRNLTMPTSQDRFSTDPPNGDMLRNGTQSHHQPSEEEMLTYNALKAQLSLIIQTLPPFAVARINSDKLEELSVSTRIEIRTDDFKGIMEEDERGLRSRQAPVQPSAPAQRATPHRAPSMSGSVSYQGHHQYGGQFAAHGRSPMPTPQHYSQTPARAQPPGAYQRPASSVPLPPPHQGQVRHPSAQPHQYRAPNGYGGMTPQASKPQPPPYAHGNMPNYSAGAGVGGQPRMQPHQGFPNIPPSPSPNQRYQQSYPAGYPQQNPPQHQGQQAMQPPQHTGLPQQLAQQRPYSPYANDAGHMPQRTMSPQVGVQPQSYSPSPTPPQQHQQLNRAPSYGASNPVNPPNGRAYNGGAAGMPPQAQNRGGNMGVTGYATVMGDAQQKHVVEQARQQVHAQQQVQAQQQAQARLDAQSRASTFGHEASHVNKVAGLAGIGLSGNMDIQRLAAMRAVSVGHGSSVPQSPKGPGAQPVRGAVSGGQVVNGGAVLSPPVASSVSPQGSSASPAVSDTTPAA